MRNVFLLTTYTTCERENMTTLGSLFNQSVIDWELLGEYTGTKLGTTRWPHVDYLVLVLVTNLVSTSTFWAAYCHFYRCVTIKAIVDRLLWKEERHFCWKEMELHLRCVEERWKGNWINVFKRQEVSHRNRKCVWYKELYIQSIICFICHEGIGMISKMRIQDYEDSFRPPPKRNLLKK